MALWLAVAVAVGFATTNGLHDAANAIAALVATRTATPAAALVLATVFNVLGSLLLGTAVADNSGRHRGCRSVCGGGRARFGPQRRGPVERDHLALRASVQLGARTRGRARRCRSVRGRECSNQLGWIQRRPPGRGHRRAGCAGHLPRDGPARRRGGRPGRAGATRRATTRIRRPIRGGLWGTSAALAFSDGANDAAKSVGIIASLLVAGGVIPDLAATPVWVKIISALALTLGTALGGWTIVNTIGRRIFRIRPLDGVASSGGCALVILGASLVGAPVSTTQVVASSVVGTGLGRRRIHRIRWGVVSAIGIAWLLTLPACALGAVVLTPLWRWIAR